MFFSSSDLLHDLVSYCHIEARNHKIDNLIDFFQQFDFKTILFDLCDILFYTL